MTDYERLSLLALAEIIDLLKEIRYPTFMGSGRSSDIRDELRRAAEGEQHADTARF